MPIVSIASLSIGIIIGLASGYVIWELVPALLPSNKSKSHDKTNVTRHIGTLRMAILTTPELSENPGTPELSEKPDGDVIQIIDLYNFTYIMNQPSCGPNVHALVLVPSPPENREKRELIRRTWANFVELPLHKNTLPFRVIFLLGLPPTAANQSDLERENFEYDDMMQGSFMDTYENKTYKHVMALKWFLAYCSNSKIFIKVDDTIFLNTPQLMIYLHNSMLHNELPSQGTITTTAPTAPSVDKPSVPDVTNETDKIIFRKQRDLTKMRLKTTQRFGKGL